MRNQRPLAFTLIEVAVVLGIVLLLLTIAIPALQVARESARQSQCKNNLRQIGLAMRVYHDAHRVFPPGIVAEAWLNAEKCAYTAAEGAGKRNSSATALTLVAPFLEDKSMYNSYNMRLGCATPGNTTWIATTYRFYICPTNPRGAGPIISPYYLGPVAPTDYVLSVGGHSLLTCASTFYSSDSSPGFPKSLRPAAGVFNINSSVRLGMIQDGASYTVMAGEGAGGPDVTHGLPEFGAAEPATANAGQVVDQGWSQGYIGSSGGKGGYGSVFAATAFDAWYDSEGKLGPADGSEKGFTPLRMRTGNLSMMRGTTYKESLPTGIEHSGYGKPNLPASAISLSPFRSFHRGMCHFLFADGSVQLLSDNIDARVYVGLSTVKGEEPGKPGR